MKSPASSAATVTQLWINRRKYTDSVVIPYDTINITCSVGLSQADGFGLTCTVEEVWFHCDILLMIIKWWNNSLPYQPALTPGNSCELLPLTNTVPAAIVSSLGAVTLIQREILICCMLVCLCVCAASLENKWWGWGVRKSESFKIITLAHSWWINYHLKKNTEVQSCWCNVETVLISNVLRFVSISLGTHSSFT